jgi:hypothetical protein
MNDVLFAAAEVQSFFEEKKWTFCIIGGIALGRWGEPRTTADVDVTLLTGFIAEVNYVDQLLTKFRPRRNDAREFALRNRVVLLQASNDIGLDIALGADFDA